MPRLLIVCIGNPLRSDDGLGWHVAQDLSRGPIPTDVQVVSLHQLTPEVAQLLSTTDRVLFVDAAREGVPGSLRYEPVEPRLGAVESHHLSPAGVLGLSRDLYGRCPGAHLIAVVGESFAIGETFSGVVAAALPSLMARIQELLHSDQNA